MSERIAIIGAGPSGCALACFLVERGIKCWVFDDEQKPGLLVGESLVPAAIPIIQRLGIEQEIAQFSTRKEGAGLRHGRGKPRVDFAFQNSNSAPDYAYNIPRPQFDAVVRKRAQALGATFVIHRAKVETITNDPDRDIQLTDESLSAAGLTRESQPDLLIDATGRTRLFSRMLKLPFKRGPRSDIAHFAHFENYPSDSNLNGQIVISVLECGWSWQIPLPDKTSVGIVLNSEGAKRYGATAEERLHNAMLENGVLNKPGSQRVSEVKTYSNYQLISQQGFGNGWILLGDALGFVDPMLSPGVFMSLESARLLDERVFSKGKTSNKQRAKQLTRYTQDLQNWFTAWSRLIEYFYNGRILKLGEMRPEITHDTSRWSAGYLIDRLVSGVLSRLVTGVGTRSVLNQTALSIISYISASNNEQLHAYAIRSIPAARLVEPPSSVERSEEQRPEADDDVAAA